MLRKIRFTADEILFEEGSCGAHAYLITRGSVAITATRDGQQIHLATLCEGELIGEMALIDSRARSATATALTEVETIAFDRQHLHSRLGDSDPLITMLLEVVLERLRTSYARLLHPAGPTPAAPLCPGHAHEGRNPAAERATEELHLLHDLQGAIGRGELSLAYQPIVATATRRLAGFEALLRWQHSRRGAVSPGLFIPVAERSEVILDLGAWVLERVCTDMPALLHASHHEPATMPFVSVNMSAAQLHDRDHCDRLIELVKRHWVDPAALKLEITESMYISDPEVARCNLDRFAREGFRIAVDDFGTGYASLGYLQQFPVDTVKIDRSCVSQALSDPRADGLVRGIIALSQTAGLEVIAEGVETQAVLEYLDGVSCAFSQGHAIAEGLPLAEAVAFARLHAPARPWHRAGVASAGAEASAAGTADACRGTRHLGTAMPVRRGDLAGLEDGDPVLVAGRGASPRPRVRLDLTDRRVAVP